MLLNGCYWACSDGPAGAAKTSRSSSTWSGWVHKETSEENTKTLKKSAGCTKRAELRRAEMTQTWICGYNPHPSLTFKEWNKFDLVIDLKSQDFHSYTACKICVKIYACNIGDRPAHWIFIHAARDVPPSIIPFLKPIDPGLPTAAKEVIKSACVWCLWARICGRLKR